MKPLRKAVPFVLALCLFLSIVPFGGLMASAEIASFEASLNMIGYPVDGVISAVFNGDKLLTLHDQNWDSAGITDTIPDGAKLVVKYDTTDVEGTGGLNFYIDALPDAATQPEIWARSRINYLPGASDQMVTLVNEDAEWTKVIGVSKGTGCYESEKHLGLPLGTKGYAIIDAPEGYELNTLSGWFFFRWDVIQADVLEDRFKFQIGWVAGDVDIPSCTTTEFTEATEAPLVNPVAKFEENLNMVGYPTEDLLSAFGGDAYRALHGANWDVADLTTNIPDGAKLIVKYDLSQVAGTVGLNFYIDTTAAVAGTVEGWHALQWKGGDRTIDFIESASTQLVTLVNENGEWSKVDGVSMGAGCYGSEKHLGLPLGTSGYAIIDMPEGYELNDLSGWFWFRWDVVSADVLEDSWKMQLGWIAGDVAIPDFSEEENQEPSFEVKGENVTVNRTEDKVIINTAADKEVKVGSLLVYDANGSVIGVPTRVGKGNLSAYNNTTEFSYMLPDASVTVKAEYVDTNASAPNFGSLGVRANTAKKGIRFEYRLNITREGDQYYTKLNGEKVAVDAFGALLCTQKNYDVIGVEGMTAGANTKGLYDVEFSKKNTRVDACAAYEDICLAMVNIPEKGYDANIYSRAYIVVNGRTYYTDIRYNTYNNAVAGRSASTVV